MLQTLKANGTQRRQPEEELGKSVGERIISDTFRALKWPFSECGESSPPLLIGVLLLAVGLQGRVHFLSEKLHLTGASQTFGILRRKCDGTLELQINLHRIHQWKDQLTWVKQNYGAQTTEFRLVHLHISHLTDQLGEHPAHEERTTVIQ